MDDTLPTYPCAALSLESSPSSLLSGVAGLALGKDPVKQSQKILEVTGKSSAGGSPSVPWGEESLAVPGMCDIGHNVLGWGCGRVTFSHFPAFLDDAEL